MATSDLMCDSGDAFICRVHGERPCREELHVYDNGSDWFVAESPEEARRFCGEFLGLESDAPPVEEFSRVPDETLLPIRFEEEPKQGWPTGEFKKHGQYERSYRLTARRWASFHGRGYLASRDI